MLTKVNVCTIQVPPKVLERVSTLKYQRCVKTNCNSFRTVLPERNGDSTLSFPLESDGSSSQVTKQCENFQHSTAQSEEQRAEGSLEARAAGQDVNTCLVCWENESDAILLECGHSGICIVCALKLWHENRRCLLCREGFAGIMRIEDRHTTTVRARAPCLVP
jgi:hypothetical protein